MNRTMFNGTLSCNKTSKSSPVFSQDSFLEVTVPIMKDNREEIHISNVTNPFISSASFNYSINNYASQFNGKSIKIEAEDETPQSDCSMAIGTNFKVKEEVGKCQVEIEIIKKEKILDVYVECNSVHYDSLVTAEPVECNLCHLTFVNQYNFLKHNVRHMKLDLFRPTIYLGLTVNDISNKKEELYMCEYCDMVFKKNIARKKHTMTVHSMNKCFCDLCGKEFKCLKYIQRHMKLYHLAVTGPQDVKCDYCDVILKHKESLYAHIKNCHSQNEYKCELCHVIFKSNYNLRQHKKRVHMNGEFKCEFCDSVIKSRYYLTEHIRREHSNGDFKCENCEAVFKSKYYLRVHERRVHSVGEFKCKICEAVFKNRNQLLVHVKKVHSGRKFKCGSCDAAFKNRSYLKNHEEKNHSSTEYKCESCAAIFKSEYSLTRHVKKLHFEYGRTFDCWCGKQFRSPVHLGNHRRSMHREKNITGKHM